MFGSFQLFGLKREVKNNHEIQKPQLTSNFLLSFLKKQIIKMMIYCPSAEMHLDMEALGMVTNRTHEQRTFPPQVLMNFP
jgi:hypothetical protein